MRLLVASLLAALALACGSAPIPLSGSLSQTQSAIRAAEEVGARSVPKAALHLKMAQDQLQQAKALLADDEEEEASVLLARAEADAELALTMAKESNLRAQAAEAMKKVSELKKGE